MEKLDKTAQEQSVSRRSSLVPSSQRDRRLRRVWSPSQKLDQFKTHPRSYLVFMRENGCYEDFEMCLDHTDVTVAWSGPRVYHRSKVWGQEEIKSIQLIKSDSKNISVAKRLFQINDVLLTFLFLKIKQCFLVNINNHYCFQHRLKEKKIYWAANQHDSEDHVWLWSYENSALITEIN